MRKSALKVALSNADRFIEALPHPRFGEESTLSFFV
jgi:hypothetical protein